MPEDFSLTKNRTIGSYCLYLGNMTKGNTYVHMHHTKLAHFMLYQTIPIMVNP
jgi:hypothetical protein